MARHARLRSLPLQLVVVLVCAIGACAKRPPPPRIPANQQHGLGFNKNVLRGKGGGPEEEHLRQLMLAEKRYFEALGRLTQNDVIPPGRSTGRADSIGECHLNEGCVAKKKIDQFLAQKWIPGYEATGNENFVQKGHYYRASPGLMAVGTGKDAHHHFEFRNYLLTRPSAAVPAPVRQLLLPAGGPWPGDVPVRTTMLPKRAGYRESDIVPLPPGVGANIVPVSYPQTSWDHMQARPPVLGMQAGSSYVPQQPSMMQQQGYQRPGFVAQPRQVQARQQQDLVQMHSRYSEVDAVADILNHAPKYSFKNRNRTRRMGAPHSGK